jgi:hypothetical protein
VDLLIEEIRVSALRVILGNHLLASEAQTMELTKNKKTGTVLQAKSPKMVSSV